MFITFYAYCANLVTILVIVIHYLPETDTYCLVTPIFHHNTSQLPHQHSIICASSYLAHVGIVE